MHSPADPEVLLVESELPVATPTFYGRVAQLEQLSVILDPRKPGRKGVVLYGIGGSGKTQLTLRYIKQSREQYKAIFWINAYTGEQIAQSFSDAARMIERSWPAKDLPNTYSGEDKTKLVLHRLRSTLHRNWLLVIDSADDLDQIGVPELIPDGCHHGSILISSTKKDAAEIFQCHGFLSINIDSLDEESCKNLLLHKAGIKDESTDINVVMSRKRNSNKITKELSGLPLIVEQAGILLRKRVLTFDNFVTEYRKHYDTFISHKPKYGDIFHKTRSMHIVLDMLHSQVTKESPDAAGLLRLAATLGPSPIPVSLLFDTKKFDFSSLDYMANAGAGLHNSDPKNIIQLRLSLSVLEDVCLVKVKPATTQFPECILLHRAICQWNTNVNNSDQEHWILSTALALSNILCEEKKSLDWFELLR